MFKNNKAMMTTIEIEWRSMRLYAVQYLMTLIIIPISFFAVSGGLAAGDLSEQIIRFAFTSSVTFFLSMFSARIMNLLSVEVMEVYVTLNMRTQEVSTALSVYYALIMLMPFTLACIIAVLMGRTIQIALLLLIFVVLCCFLSQVAVALSTLLRNPYKSGALIPYLAFLILAVTPLERPVLCWTWWMINPFYDLYQLLAYCFGAGETRPWLFIAQLGYVIVLTGLTAWFVRSRLSKAYVLEQLV